MNSVPSLHLTSRFLSASVSIVVALLVLLSQRACGEEKENIDASVLEEIGHVLDAKIETFKISITGKGQYLRINKNGKDTGSFPLDGFTQLVVVVVKGKGLGLYPRDTKGPDGLSIRILAKGPKGGSTFSVSYMIPEKTTDGHSLAFSKEDGLLYDQTDKDDSGTRGNLKLWIDTKEK